MWRHCVRSSFRSPVISDVDSNIINEISRVICLWGLSVILDKLFFSKFWPIIFSGFVAFHKGFLKMWKFIAQSLSISFHALTVTLSTKLLVMSLKRIMRHFVEITFRSGFAVELMNWEMTHRFTLNAGNVHVTNLGFSARFVSRCLKSGETDGQRDEQAKRLMRPMRQNAWQNHNHVEY